jgi:hypothetical protein
MRSSSSSMTSENVFSGGCVPLSITIRPLMKNVGVPLTP